jgi:hypothetical protein
MSQIELNLKNGQSLRINRLINDKAPKPITVFVIRSSKNNYALTFSGTFIDCARRYKRIGDFTEAEFNNLFQ